MREQNTDRQTDRDTYRQTDRQTELKYYIDISQDMIDLPKSKLPMNTNTLAKAKFLMCLFTIG